MSPTLSTKSGSLEVMWLKTAESDSVSAQELAVNLKLPSVPNVLNLPFLNFLESSSLPMSVYLN